MEGRLREGDCNESLDDRVGFKFTRGVEPCVASRGVLLAARQRAEYLEVGMVFID